MIIFLRKRMESFTHAFRGAGYVLRTQPNSWIHAAATVLVLITGFWIGLTPLQWAVLTLAITIVWTAEFINTAIEAVVDLVQPDFHAYAKVAKDAAAGAVLLAAIGSIVIGGLILGSGLMNRLVY